MLPYLVTDVSLPGHTGGNRRKEKCSCFSTVTFWWTPAPHSGWKYIFWAWFLQRHQGKCTTSFVTVTSLHFCYPMLQKCCVSLVLESSWNCRRSVFLRKAQPWLSALDVYESAGANWKHTTVGREIATGEADIAGLPVRSDLGLRWKGKAAKGGCKTFEGEKLKIQSFRSAVSVIRE